MLARALAATSPSAFEVIPLTREELDITDADSIERALTALRPSIVINSAAYTAVDRAEDDIEAAERVNGIAPGLLGAAAARREIKVVHFSTDYVFDGRSSAPYTEHDDTNPINAYGRSKLHGEHALRDSGAEHLLIRTQWLFGDSGKSFPDTMWTRARSRLPTRVIDDQWGAPTFAGDLARATWSMLGDRGIVHVVSEGVATWYDVARRIFAATGAGDQLSPCSTSEYPTPAQRPQNGRLDTALVRSRGHTLPPWEDAIDGFIERRSAELR